MPLLAAMLSGIFTSIAGFFASFVGKKLAVAMTAIATLTTLTVGLYGALSLALNGIAAQVPALPGAQIGIWVAVPDNLPTCFAAILSTDTVIALYRWSMNNLKILALAT